MSGWIEIIIALIIIALIGRYITYIVSFLSIFPVELLSIMMFAIALSIVLFVIHRKD